MSEHPEPNDMMALSAEALSQIVHTLFDDTSIPMTEEQIAALREFSRRNGVIEFDLPPDASHDDVLAAESERNRIARIRLLNMMPGMYVPEDASMEETVKIEMNHLFESFK